jgi:hypothetical protein
MQVLSTVAVITYLLLDATTEDGSLQLVELVEDVGNFLPLHSTIGT